MTKLKSDYIARREGEQVLWFGNFKTNIAINAASLGLTAPQVAALVGSCTTVVDNINNVMNKKTALANAMAQKETANTAQTKFLRTEVARIKTLSGYTAAIGESLGIIASELDFDENTFKPEIKANNFAGFVRIVFTKKGTEGVNIYHRKKGEAQWNFLARDTKSPYDDHITLVQPNQPEHWEYRAFGVIDDAEIGAASDIVEVVFGN